MLKCQDWREVNTLPAISSHLGRIFSVFRQKNDEPNPSEMDIDSRAEVFILQIPITFRFGKYEFECLKNHEILATIMEKWNSQKNNIIITFHAHFLLY